MEEEWKPIVITKNGKMFDFTGRYEVSNIEGKIRNVKTGRILKQVINTYGYSTITLCNQGFLVHRIVATAFIPNPNNLPVVNHINEIKTDNSVDNLEWTTQKKNVNHGTGIQRMAEKQKGKKHSDKTKQKIRESMQGKHLSEEHKKRLSESKKRWWSNKN